MLKNILGAIKRFKRPKAQTNKIKKRLDHIERRLAVYSDRYRRSDKESKILDRIRKGMEHVISLADNDVHKLYIVSGTKESFDYFIVRQYEMLADLSIESKLGFTDKLYNYSSSVTLNRIKVLAFKSTDEIKIRNMEDKEITLYYLPIERNKIIKLVNEYKDIQKEYLAY